MATTARPFFGRIEALRGLGAVAVALVHFGPSPWASLPLGALTPTVHTFFPGHAALLAFFVISGMVLRLMLEHGPPTVATSAVAFFVKRFFRVYPIVVVSLLLTLWYDRGQITTYGQTRPLQAGELGRNLLLLETSINPAFWALQVEVAMIPVIFALYWAERRWSANVVLLAAWLLTPLTFVPGNVGYVFAVVLGMTVPTYGRAFVLGLTRRRLVVGLTVALLVLEFTAPLCGLFSPWTRFVEAYAGWFVVSVVAYRLDVRWLRVLDGRAVRWLGRISGSFYVLHMLVIQVFLNRLPTSAIGPLVPTAALLSVIGVASVAYLFVEAPCIAVGKRVANATSAWLAANLPWPRVSTEPRLPTASCSVVYKP